MSFNVLVIPEDPTLNGYILKPLTQAIVTDAGRPAANVKVLTRPRLRGYTHARRAIRDELPDLYAHLHLWLFFPDADRAAEDATQDLENRVGERGVALFCCIAQPELEIYACVAFRNDIPARWEEVRQHPRMKEEVFDPLLSRHGDPRQPGAGRGLMINESLQNLPLLFRLCPELRRLRDRIAAHLQEG